MKTELENIDLIELSNSDLQLISGGGPGFNWLGEVCGYAANVVDFINDIPLNVVIAGACAYTDLQNYWGIYMQR